MPYLSDDTTAFSNISLYGGQLRTSRISSTGSALVNELWVSTLSLAGVNAQFAKISLRVPAMVVQGSSSSFTTGEWPEANGGSLLVGDIILPTIGVANAGQVSSISSGLVLHSHVTQAGGVFEFRYSNVSTLVQNQSAQTIAFVRIRIT